MIFVRLATSRTTPIHISSSYHRVTFASMPVTRSTTRQNGLMPATSLVETGMADSSVEITSKRKVTPPTGSRKAVGISAGGPTRKKAVGGRAQSGTNPAPGPAEHEPDLNLGTVLPLIVLDASRTFVPAKLTFSLEDAKRHLTQVDPRFEAIFEQLKCKPFEYPERFDPFSTLASSILGQQISWKAARSIKHRFIRLFNASLPEKPKDYNMGDYFPTAKEVAQMDVASLRSAGLSQRKAEYVVDLASRFADGRLSTEKLLDADDEELYKMLIAVRGIGRWTVDMFAIFSLRRPDILPAGDLGVQRGIVRWFLSLHSPDYNVTISPEKLPQDPEEGSEGSSTRPTDQGDVLPTLNVPGASSEAPSSDIVSNDAVGDISDAPPAPFTPSINRVLSMRTTRTGEPVQPLFPLPVGLTATMLRGRLDPKKKVKGAFLTPKEMEELTNPWRPYRSIGVYYMWALAEDRPVNT